MNALGHKFPEKIIGEFVILQKMEYCDAEFIYNLRKSNVARYLNCPPDYSIESQIKWQTNRPDSEGNYIIYNFLKQKVGMISIYDCDWANGVSNVGHLLLNEQYVHKGTPYGMEVLKITYGYVFNTMNFRKISGTINTKNKKIYDLQRYLGMIDEGYFKDHVILNGKPQDIYFLSLFKEGYKNYAEKIDRILQKFRNENDSKQL